jgi:hypothetical protein
MTVAWLEAHAYKQLTSNIQLQLLRHDQEMLQTHTWSTMGATCHFGLPRDLK